ncbi:hypothetical protein GGGNBK_23280 (plasmid) [Sporosarcina sp. ANT_H38]
MKHVKQNLGPDLKQKLGFSQIEHISIVLDWEVF